MSLAFLAKKTWNPTNLRNVEKVWLAEQKADAEEKKLQEFRKQIAEERQIQELKELQVHAGLVDKDALEKLDWMYEGPMATMEDKKDSLEEYLTGKEYTVKSEKTELKEVESQPGMLFVGSVNAKNEMFSRLHEDPLLLIKQNELKKREDLVKNPVKMARIKKQLEDEIRTKKERKKAKSEAKKAKKEAKRTKKEAKKEQERTKGGAVAQREDSSGKSSGSDDESDMHRVKLEGGKRAREQKAGDGRWRDEGDKRPRVHSSDRDGRLDVARSDRGRDERRRSPERRDRQDDRRRRDSRSRSRGSRGRGRYARSPVRDEKPSHSRHDRSRSHSAVRVTRERDDDKDGRRVARKAHGKEDGHGAENEGRRYGLQNAGTAKKVSVAELGPDPALVAAKQREKDEKLRQAAQARQRSTLTEEEKRQRLADMSRDAAQRDDLLRRRVEAGRKMEEKEEAIDQALGALSKKHSEAERDPAFLRKLQEKAYMQGDATLEDRITTQRHTRQRNVDESSFLK